MVKVFLCVAVYQLILCVRLKHTASCLTAFLSSLSEEKRDAPCFKAYVIFKICKNFWRERGVQLSSNPLLNFYVNFLVLKKSECINLYFF